MSGRWSHSPYLQMSQICLPNGIWSWDCWEFTLCMTTRRRGASRSLPYCARAFIMTCILARSELTRGITRAECSRARQNREEIVSPCRADIHHPLSEHTASTCIERAGMKYCRRFGDIVANEEIYSDEIILGKQWRVQWENRINEGGQGGGAASLFEERNN